MENIRADSPLIMSIIIPTLNEGEYIGKCLESIVQQEVPRSSYEIIVVDGKSEDDTVKIANKYADKIIVADKRGIGHQQNIGAIHSSGDFLMFMHGDTYLIKKNVLEIILKYFENTLFVGGAIHHKYYPENKYKIKLYNIFDNALALLFLNLKKPRTGGPITVVRKNVFWEVGGFVDSICEDIEIGYRLSKKGKIFRNPEVLAYSSSRRLEKEGILKNALRYTISMAFTKINKDVYITYPEIR